MKTSKAEDGGDATPQVEPATLNPLTDRDELTLALIDHAIASGATWAQIARTLRLKDRNAAKKKHRDLQRVVAQRTANS